jgi:DNA-binding transcriptional LysR family regulator
LTRQPYVWEFHKKRQVLTVKTKSRLLVSDARTMLTECVSGAGVAQVFTSVVRDLLQNQKLVELFPDWPDEKFPLYAYYPSRHHPAAKVRVFVDFVLQAVR